MTILLARIIYKEKIKYSQYLAIIIEFIGVAILIMANGIFSVNIGVIWLLVAAFLLSLYNILQRKLKKEYTALQTTIYSIFIGEVFLLVFLPSAVNEIKHTPIMQFFYIAVLGILSSAIAYISWVKAISKSPKTSSVSNYMFLTPFLTSIFGIVFINEKLDIQTIVGGILILIGMFIYNFSSKIFKNNCVRPHYT
jgi:drug/metabolite transporter (DMT)-like permease